MSDKLPEWPVPLDDSHISDQTEMNAAWCDYERARAEAALARLRVAVEALGSLGQSLGCKYGNGAVSVGELLSTIGEVPEA